MSETAPTATATPEKSATPALKAILGQKIGMTQIFDAHGQIVPVTVVQAGPCHVTQVITKEKHGYAAVQVAFGEIQSKWVNKPHAGQFKKSNVTPVRWLREFRTDKAGFEVGQSWKADVFAPGDYVDVQGISKGHGFSGVMKRHNFGGGPSTHGQSDRQRAPGSIGSNTFPGHVWKGQRMAGHFGVDKTTVQHLEVVQVVPEKDLMLIKGALPGADKSLVIILETVKTIKRRVLRAVEPSKKDKAKAAAKAAPAPKAKAK
jgi:large subunit ribosomal protein L3